MTDAPTVDATPATRADLDALRADVDQQFVDFAVDINALFQQAEASEAAFHRAVVVRFDSVDARFDGIDTRLDRMDARFAGIDARFDGIDTRLDGIDARLDGIDTRLDRMDARLDGMDTRLAGIDLQLDGLTEGVNRLLAQQGLSPVGERE